MVENLAYWKVVMSVEYLVDLLEATMVAQKVASTVVNWAVRLVGLMAVE